MKSFRIKAGLAVVTLIIFASAGFARNYAPSKPPQDDTGRPLVMSTDQTPDVFIDWPTFYGVQQTGLINTSFDCFGMFGKKATLWGPSVPSWPWASFESPPGSGKEYLWNACFWIGGIVGNDTLVSTGMDGWLASGHEFFPPNTPYRGSVRPFDYPTDGSMRGVFLDTTLVVDPYAWMNIQHRPLNIKVSNRSHVWQDDGSRGFVIYDVVILNIGDELIEDAYVGIYADADIWDENDPESDCTDDLVGSIKNQRIAYIIDDNGDLVTGPPDPASGLRKCFAAKLLASSRTLPRQNFNWWISHTWEDHDFGPRLKPTPNDPYFDFGYGGLGTPQGDVNKYYVLSHNEWDYDQIYTASIEEDDPRWLYPLQDVTEDISDGQDTRFLLSFGPVDLEPGEDLRLLFAFLAGEYMHTLLFNTQNLPHDPDEYIKGISFDTLLMRAERAEERAAELIDPLLPPIGLELAYQDSESVTIDWDPWGFDNIDGYEILLSVIPPEDIPYPGVIPPWVLIDDPEPYKSSTIQPSYTFSNLRQGKTYYTKIAHRSEAGTGQTGEAVAIDLRDKTPPMVDETTIFYYEYCGPDASPSCKQYPTISWSLPQGTSVSQYNIYRFTSAADLAARYYPFYDRGEHSSIMEPEKTIEVDGVTYYYYAMDTYDVLRKSTHEFTDYFPVDGAYYIVTAVDNNGHESQFSEPVKVVAINDFEEDVLVLTNLKAKWAATDSIRAFYDDVLEGYEYDIYSVADTATKYNCNTTLWECIAWQDFTRYANLIIDEDRSGPFFTEEFEFNSNGVTNYLLCGGNVLYFGGFEGFIDVDIRKAQTYELNDVFIQRFFGVDNVFYYGLGFYGLPFPCAPALDTCFGFKEAETVSQSLSSVYYDQTRDPFASIVDCYWLTASPPAVATFQVNNSGITTHVYRSLYPEISWVEGDPVGVRTVSDDAETYLFGFNLWYMARGPARLLLSELLKGTSQDIELTRDPTGVAASFGLSQNYPNPFNPSTEISFTLPKPVPVKLRVFNIRGRLVKELIDSHNMPAGAHSVEWKGDNMKGDKVSSGIYFYRLEAGDAVASKKMILLK